MFYIYLERYLYKYVSLYKFIEDLFTGRWEFGILPNFVVFQFSRISSPPYIFPTVNFPLPISREKNSIILIDKIVVQSK